jgi:hypothetical protein
MNFIELSFVLSGLITLQIAYTRTTSTIKKLSKYKCGVKNTNKGSVLFYGHASPYLYQYIRSQVTGRACLGYEARIYKLKDNDEYEEHQVIKPSELFNITDGETIATVDFSVSDFSTIKTSTSYSNSLIRTELGLKSTLLTWLHLLLKPQYKIVERRISENDFLVISGKLIRKKEVNILRNHTKTDPLVINGEHKELRIKLIKSALLTGLSLSLITIPFLGITISDISNISLLPPLD